MRRSHNGAAAAEAYCENRARERAARNGPNKHQISQRICDVNRSTKIVNLDLFFFQSKPLGRPSTQTTACKDAWLTNRNQDLTKEGQVERIVVPEVSSHRFALPGWYWIWVTSSWPKLDENFSWLTQSSDDCCKRRSDRENRLLCTSNSDFSLHFKTDLKFARGYIFVTQKSSASLPAGTFLHFKSLALQPKHDKTYLHIWLWHPIFAIFRGKTWRVITSHSVNLVPQAAWNVIPKMEAKLL